MTSVLEYYIFISVRGHKIKPGGAHMLVNFGNVEVDIKVRSTIGKGEDFSDLDTFFFLNELSVMAEYSAQYLRSKGLQGLADNHKAKGLELYNQLKEAGLYEEYK